MSLEEMDTFSVGGLIDLKIQDYNLHHIDSEDEELSATQEDIDILFG